MGQFMLFVGVMWAAVVLLSIAIVRVGGES